MAIQSPMDFLLLKKEGHTPFSRKTGHTPFPAFAFGIVVLLCIVLTQ